MRLTNAQYDYLRLLGHSLRPAVKIGAGGLTNSVIKEIDAALKREELVKVKVPFGARARREEVLGTLAPLSDALLIHRIGDAAVLYRPNTEPLIELPSAADDP